MHLSSVFHHCYCICMLMSCFSLYLYLSSETSTQQCVHMSFVLWSRRAYLCPKDVFFLQLTKNCYCIPILSLYSSYWSSYSLVPCWLQPGHQQWLDSGSHVVALFGNHRTIGIATYYTHTIYCDAQYTHNVHNVLSCTGSLPTLRESQQLITSLAALPPSTPKTILEPPHLGQTSKYLIFLKFSKYWDIPISKGFPNV